MDNRRAPRLLVALIAVTLATPAFTSQEKGGSDETGPYDLVANWPQNPCGAGFRVGSTGGIFAETPDKVFIFQRGCLPVVENDTLRHAVWSRPDAERGRLRSVGNGSRSPPAMGSHPLHRQSRRQDDRFLGAAQRAASSARTRSSSTRTIPTSTCGSWTMARSRSTS